MRQDGLQTAAEVAEVVTILMHLHPLAVILDLGEHAIGALLHRVLNGLAGLSLGQGEQGLKTFHKGLLSKLSQRALGLALRILDPSAPASTQAGG